MFVGDRRMTSIATRLRRRAQQALLGHLGAEIQTWAWRLASVHPRLRALGKVRSGQIHAPLAALRRGSLEDPKMVHLRERLADMAEFSARPTSGPDQSPRRPPGRSYNRRVVHALHSCGAYDPSGYASRSVALISALGRQGVQSDIILRPGYPWDLAAHRNLPHARFIEHQDLRFALEPAPAATLGDADSLYIANYAALLQARAAAHDATVIHAASNYLNGAAAAVAGQRLGVASVYELRGLWHLTRAFLEPSYHGSEHFDYCERRELAACSDVDHVVTLSPGLKRWLVEHGIPEARISIVGNAAHPSRGLASDQAAAARAVRARLGLPAGAAVVGYLGALVAYEGLDRLLAAHARTPQPRRPFLLIVGDGAQQAALRRLAARLGASDQVIFAGRVPADQVAAHFGAMDAVVLPRCDDPMTRLVPAIKPFEALAHGRPLFVSPALAEALGSTLPDGYQVLDIDQLDGLDQVIEAAARALPAMPVPTWDDRAAALVECFVRVTG